ncbi:hypothetical protein QBC44DRAFT_390383 [Cladorrhinum sp. PSN332]|nr:hypothetical protein QBC44DRAFT_390383 [Cladorrhinum sp. PSN332]
MDAHAIWHRIFRSILLGLDLSTSMFWVIDGLDECDTPREAIRFFAEILEAPLPIRIPITSRHMRDVGGELAKSPSGWEMVTIEEHTDDFRTCINQDLQWFGSQSLKENIIKQLLDSAQENFLWLKLTVDCINRCHTEEETSHAIREIPSGMEALFGRMAKSISTRGSAEQKLVSAILSWAVCSHRPLSIRELLEALETTGVQIINLQVSIMDLCGGFLVVDGKDTVTLIHETAREYLLSPKRPFNIDEKAAQEMLLTICLACLSAPDLRYKLRHGKQSPFVSYAASSWVAHPYNYSNASACPEFIPALIGFLKSKDILTRIEAPARPGQLQILIKASTDLLFVAASLANSIMSDSAPNHSPSDHELIRRWAVDLHRIFRNFREQLQRYPENIHKAIPLFCPPSSIIYQQFAQTKSLDIQISGRGAADWDDVTTRLIPGRAYVGMRIFAKGKWIFLVAADNIDWTVTTIFVYHAYTYQLTRQFRLTDASEVYQVNEKGTLLITCGNAAFANDDATAIILTERGRQWRLSLCRQDSVFEEASQITDPDTGLEFVSVYAAVKSDGSLLAIESKEGSIMVCASDGPQCIAHSTKVSGLKYMVWHPSTLEIFGLHTIPNTGLGQTHWVFRWDFDNDQLVQEGLKIPPRSRASDIEVSPNGQLLAISIWGELPGQNIQTLRSAHDLSLLYQIQSNSSLFGVAFSVDGRQLYDITDAFVRVRESSILLKLSGCSDQRGLVKVAKTDQVRRGQSIPASSPQPNGPLYCTATHSGLVMVHDSQTDEPLPLICGEELSAPYLLEWNSKGTTVAIASGPNGNRISIYRIAQSTRRGAIEEHLVSNMSISAGPKFLDQVLFHPHENILLLSRSGSRAMMLSFSDNLVIAETSMIVHGRWITHPTDDRYLILVEPSTVSIYTWETLEKVSWIHRPHPRPERLTSSHPSQQLAVQRLIPTPSGK